MRSRLKNQTQDYLVSGNIICETDREAHYSFLVSYRFIYNLDNDAFDIGNITIKMENSRAIHFPFNGSNLMGTLDRVISTGVREVPIGM